MPHARERVMPASSRQDSRFTALKKGKRAYPTVSPTGCCQGSCTKQGQHKLNLDIVAPHQENIIDLLVEAVLPLFAGQFVLLLLVAFVLRSLGRCDVQRTCPQQPARCPILPKSTADDTVLNNISYCSYPRSVESPMPQSLLPCGLLCPVCSCKAGLKIVNLLFALSKRALEGSSEHEALAKMAIPGSGSNLGGDTENYVAGPKNICSLPVSPTMSWRKSLIPFHSSLVANLWRLGGAATTEKTNFFLTPGFLKSCISACAAA